MKRNSTKRIFSLPGILLLAFLAGPFTSAAQQTFSKKLEKVFKNVRMVKLAHRNGPVKIMKSRDKNFRITANISLKAESESDANIVFGHVELDADQLGDRLGLETKFATRNWNSNNGSIRIEFADGTKVRNISDLEIEVVVYSPELKELKVDHRYGSLQIAEGLTTNMGVKLYEGRLETADVRGQLDLDLKYSKASIGNFGSADIILYDSELNAQSGGNADLDAKYSEVELQDLGNVAIKSYESKIEFANLGNLMIEDKYSDCVFGNFGNAVLDVYESEFNMMNGGNLNAKSKYSKYDIESLGTMNFELSYEDRVRVRRLQQLSGEAKYSDFMIGLLQERLTLQTYEGNVTIEEISGPIKEISFSGKYTDLKMDLPRSAKYWLEAKVEYGRFSYPEDEIDFEYYYEKNDKLEMKGRVKGTTDSSPKISITAYDGRIDLN